jgi:CubicO group peptidase (beta-lactamase class C family)
MRREIARVAVAGLLAGVVSLSACGSDGTGPGPGTVTPPPAPLTFSSLVDSIRRADDLPALGAAIVTSDSVARLVVSGVRRYGGTTAVGRDDKWHLGSVLKHQVSVLVARLVAQGVLTWSTTLAEHFPEMATSMRAEYRTRTLRDLLSHSAGLPRDYTTETPMGGRAARERASAWALMYPPVVAPGTYAYSNVGYMIAGTIIERALARDFEDVMRERLWTPLAMSSAGFGQAGSAGSVDEPHGHHLSASGVRTIYGPDTPNADNPPEYGPAGRAHMSLSDWARFTSALLSAERGRETPVLSSAAWRALTTTGVVATGNDAYSHGLVLGARSWAGGRALYHDGTNTRHYALVGIAPLRDFAILIATNQWSPTMGATMDRIFGRLAAFHQSDR